MRRRRRRYIRKSGSAAGKWVVVFCVVLTLAFAVNTLAPGIKDKIQSMMGPVYERSQQYKVVFARFGEALSGDKSFTDAFSSIVATVKKS